MYAPQAPKLSPKRKHAKRPTTSQPAPISLIPCHTHTPQKQPTQLRPAKTIHLSLISRVQRLLAPSLSNGTTNVHHKAALASSLSSSSPLIVTHSSDTRMVGWYQDTLLLGSLSGYTIGSAALESLSWWVGSSQRSCIREVLCEPRSKRLARHFIHPRGHTRLVSKVKSHLTTSPSLRHGGRRGEGLRVHLLLPIGAGGRRGRAILGLLTPTGRGHRRLTTTCTKLCRRHIFGRRL